MVYDRSHRGGEMSLRVRQSLCTACHKCELACSLEKEGAFIPSLSRIWIEEVGFPMIPVPVICHQCTNAPCEEICPTKAISLSDKTDAYIVDVDECIGCGQCAEVCPWGAIDLNLESGKAYKCDLCNGRPKCVEACNYGALMFTERTTTPQERRTEFALRIAKSWKSANLDED